MIVHSKQKTCLTSSRIYAKKFAALLLDSPLHYQKVNIRSEVFGQNARDAENIEFVDHLSTSSVVSDVGIFGHSSIRIAHDSNEKIENSDSHVDLESDKEDELHPDMTGIQNVAHFETPEDRLIGRHHGTLERIEVVSKLVMSSELLKTNTAFISFLLMRRGDHVILVQYSHAERG